MMNIECSQKALAELNDAFRFNDAVIRDMVIKMDAAETEPSIMMKEEEQRPRRSSSDEGGERRRPAAEESTNESA